ncbi:hypothetical protein RJP21_04640 [Paenibacillus sp. VCA1]|uniref:hypothetical protein n=1 Tax=Paenibacillus sp. VCA1 TaxID=3039148 RepID=UPI00287270C6|nr:hypothetical protein [Paenibacillus sp. VCA1]MDR9852888.1 hypothetical protein [Paenibacillus sp. VCA1]
MTQKPMYPAMVNSPETELTADINVTDTEISVLDATKLPAAPNLLTLGSDETAETVRYTEVNGNTLTVERGFQGAAKSWSKGTKVARYFTAYDHDAARENIDGLYDRLDTAESETLTLQPGVQIVTAKRDARFKLGSIKGKTEINGQGRIGIIGVENPYVIRYGNLLPPFYEWAQSGNIRMDSPYDVTITASSTTQEFLQYDFASMSGQTYTITGANIRVVDLTNVVILAFTGNTKSAQTFSVPASCKQLRIVVSNATQATVGTGNIVTSPGTYRTQNPILNFGDKSLSFSPREDVMLAFQTELHANPTDGSEPDELFERGGQYFKLAKWRKLALDGSLNYSFRGAASGFKSISFSLTGVKPGQESGFLIKYNGTQLINPGNDILTQSDMWSNRTWESTVVLSIANTDSGWSDNYTPTPDEIKACILGWRMYAEGQNAATGLYESGKKWWAYRKDGKTANTSGDMAGGTSALPTTQAPNWSSYNLLYKLASPTIEPITSEGCLTLTESDNQIEVGTGIVLREQANAQGSTSYSGYYINETNVFPASKLKQKVQKILSVYKYSRKDKWNIVTGNAYGNEFAFKPFADFDPTAPYSATYIKLDKSPVVPVTGYVATNEKAQLIDLTAGVQEALTRVSVAEQMKAEKDASGWITPTLLNGWIPLLNFGVRVKDNRLEFRGAIKCTNLVLGTAMVLPSEMRASVPKTIAVGAFEGTVGSSVAVADVYTNGNIDFIALANRVVVFEGLSISLN